jgi:hypothetical protein
MLERVAEEALGGILVRAFGAAGEVRGQLASVVGRQPTTLRVDNPAPCVATAERHRA